MYDTIMVLYTYYYIEHIMLYNLYHYIIKLNMKLYYYILIYYIILYIILTNVKMHRMYKSKHNMCYNNIMI